MGTLYIGLGNPENERQKNRYNYGFRAIKSLLNSIPPQTMTKGRLTIHNNNAYLIPTTKMNDSGKAVESALETLLRYKTINIDNLVIFYADVELPLGEYKITSKKSNTRHNGVKSILDYKFNLKTTRIKLGIGKPPKYTTLYSYVLSDFTEKELKIVDKTLEKIKVEL
jgi:PTH1 family peptidyl-tRNA hydrolase